MSFASATDTDLEEGVKRLATVIQRFQEESVSRSQGNGNRADSSGHDLGLQNGKLENGKHHHSCEQSVQQIVDDNEEMSLDAAVHTAADSQPEAC